MPSGAAYAAGASRGDLETSPLRTRSGNLVINMATPLLVLDSEGEEMLANNNAHSATVSRGKSAVVADLPRKASTGNKYMLLNNAGDVSECSRKKEPRPLYADKSKRVKLRGPKSERNDSEKIRLGNPVALAPYTVSSSESECADDQNLRRDESSRGRTLPNSGIEKSQILEDLSKGAERVKIAVVNDVDDEGPPLVHYIPENLKYQKAYVKFTLARIGEYNCCPGCAGDCLESPLPCACATETGGLFAYTEDGLLREEFLNSYLSRLSDPTDKFKAYCAECPHEKRKKNRKPEACKGHLIKPFIKECWRKCGCHMMCGNRVVQRGITCNLQVFKTHDGKGWGVRTVDALPRGAFVCEYIGEILTNMELYDRNSKIKWENERHTYPVNLDADGNVEEGLKDEELLSLDATLCGNVGRFINHRCCDSNLIDIPVEVETPDHHYYHIAFFTTRKIEALEELNWDYRIDFADVNHPIPAFKCRCGSLQCRDK